MVPRVIPVLLVSDGYLVKPVRFSGDRYIGDPINAVRIFNEKQVDELMICDIDATVRGSGVNYTLIEEIASEAFMPVGYGGGVASAADAQRITGIGVEKVILNTAAFRSPHVVSEVSEALGSSSTVVSVDAKRKLAGGWETYASRARIKLGLTPSAAAAQAQAQGAGEILVSSIDREGTFSGYDLKLIRSVAESVSVPVLALGGAQSLSDFAAALEAGASAVAAGSAFVMTGKHRAVLINYPSPVDIRSLAAIQ
ncbi:AglZ/HisF2 family acetamidino modification protein [Agrococcus sp. DT81.2]|uniref:AglZ/HisF2 family acetamidino modification protein n=1 Tax=Agrococcus sp. DT81.2 TaxID=3393414 RepID=UPI003CE485A2